MKINKLMGIAAAAALGLAVSLPAAAVTTDQVSGGITVDKTYTIDVTQKRVDITNSSEADATKNVTNSGNSVTEDMSETASIDDGGTAGNGSFNGATGVIGVNQSPGSINNQGNSTGIAMTRGAAGAAGNDAIVTANASATETNGGYISGPDSTGTSLGNTFSAQNSTRTDQVVNSFTGASGVMGINQASGSMNNQDNAVALSLGAGSVAALSLADLSMSNSYGSVNDTGSTNSDTLSGAFGTVSGVVSVNQSSGSLNNQSNVVSVAATGFPVP